jgi:hypothetical protein
MKTGKSERDLLLDQTLALVKAAIDQDAVSSSTARARQNPIRSNEIAAEKIARTEQDPLVSRTYCRLSSTSPTRHRRRPEQHGKLSV